MIPAKVIPMTEQDTLRLRANGILAQNEIAVYIAEATWAENVETGMRRRLFVEGQMLESRRTLLHD